MRPLHLHAISRAVVNPYGRLNHQGSGFLSAARNGNPFLHVGTNIAFYEPQFNDAHLSYERETRRNPLLLAAQNDHMETVEILLSETRPSRMCVCRHSCAPCYIGQLTLATKLLSS